MNGLLLIDKPKGMTSHDVVNQIRKLTKIKKVGHTGTLDPNASGLLVICIGEATKMIPYLENSSKVYEADIVFGKQTTTDDIEGEIIAQKATKDLTYNELQEALSGFIGEIDQIPPAYSAKKVNGKKLYEYARKNKPVEIKPVKVTVEEFRILNSEEFPEFIKAQIKCSKGTYIRSLARDLGKAMNNFGFLKDLKRTETNGYKLEESIKLEDLDSDNIINFIKPLESLQQDLKRVTVNYGSAKYLNNGNRLYQLDLKDSLDDLDEGEEVILLLNGKVKGIGTKVIKKNEIFIQPKKVLNVDTRVL